MQWTDDTPQARTVDNNIAGKKYYTEKSLAAKNSKLWRWPRNTQLNGLKSNIKSWSREKN